MLRKFARDPNPINVIGNPQFALASVAYTTPASWTEIDGGLPNSANFGRYSFASYSSGFAASAASYVHLVTPWIYTFGLYGDSQTITAGQYWAITQSVDLTNVDTLLYTVGLGAKIGQDNSLWEVYIDGAQVDSENLGVADGSFNVFANRSIDVSGYTGSCTLKFMLTAGTSVGTSWVVAELANIRAFETTRKGPIWCFRDDDVTGVTISATSASSTMPLASMLDLVPSNLGAVGAPSDEFIHLDFGNSWSLLRKNISFVALFNTNIDEGEAVNLQMNDDDAWGSDPVDVPMTWDNGTLYAVLENPVVYRYLRIKTSGKAARTTAINCGVLMFGEHGRFSLMYSIGQMFMREYRALTNQADGGRVWAKKRSSRGRFECMFEDLSPQQVMELAWVHQQAHGSYRPIALVPAPDDADYDELVLLGLLTSQVETPERDFELYDQKLAIDELTWGREV